MGSSKGVYRIGLGVTFGATWSGLLLCGVVYFVLESGDHGTDFARWGPSNNTVFGGIRVNTWPRWAFVMAYSTLSQVVYSVISGTLSPYIDNVIQDHKTPREQKGSYVRAQLIVELYTFYHWISSIFDVFLWITLQVQYLAPAIIMDLVITAYFTHGYLKTQPLDPLLPTVAPIVATEQ